MKAMETQTPPLLHEKPRHRALTPLRVLRGSICLLVLISTAFVMLIYFGFITSVLLRFCSIHYSRKTTSFIFGSWLALWPFLFEKINKTKVIFSGQMVPSKERVLLIANHRTEVDWMYLWDLALRKGVLGYIKFVLKSSLMKLPIFGWAFHILEFVSVERKWEIDEFNLKRMLSSFDDPKDHLWLALFPEGTDFTEKKCMRNQKYAAENGLPVLKNVLLPKTKGFCACLKELRGTLDAVYDITIGYKYRCPSLMDTAFGLEPTEVHIHVRRISLDKIPKSEEQIASWLMDTFAIKDQMLTNFHTQDYFSKEETEKDLSMIKCVVNFLAVIFVTSVCIFFTLFGSVWFKIYVVVACCYLVSATYFNIRPSPILWRVGKRF